MEMEIEMNCLKLNKVSITLIFENQKVRVSNVPECSRHAVYA